MRKSFKKVLCAVMAASMVFSTPIATNVVAQAATGAAGASVTVPVTVTTDLKDVVSESKENGYASKMSDFYSVEGDFDVTFTLTNITADMIPDSKVNWHTPLLDIRTAADATDATLIARYRADCFLIKGDEITTKIPQWESDNPTWMTNGEWNGFKGICNDATATVNVKKSGATYYVTETFTGNANTANTAYAGKSYVMKYITTPAEVPDTTYLDFTMEKCTVTVSKVEVAKDVYGVTAKKTLNLVTNGTNEGNVTAVAKHNDVVDNEAVVEYKSADEKVATVDTTGKVTAVANGETTITSTYQGETATTKVVVTTDAKSVAISGEGVAEGKGTLSILKNKKDGNVAPGKVALTATVTPENASQKDIKWSVSGSAATVDAKGVVTTTDDAKDGDKVTVTATVKGTTVSDSVELTIGVKEESFVDPASVAVSPAAVTANAGDKVSFTAAVYGEGDALATNQGVTWSAKNASGTAISISEDGVLTVPSDVKEGDKITVTATSKANGKVTGTATIKVHLYESLTGTKWWEGRQDSKDRILKGDGSVSFLLENNAGDASGFCVEAYAVKEEVENGVTKYVKYVNNDAATDEKGAYITSVYNGSFDGWVAGIPASKFKLGPEGRTDFAGNPDSFYNISVSKESFLPEHTYKVTFTKKGNDYLVLVKDMDNNTWFYRQIFKGVDMESDTLGIHFMAQLGTFNLVDTDEHLTTDTTDKPQVVRPKPNPGNNTTPSPSPSPSNNNTNKNNTTNNNTTNNNKTTTLTDAKSTVKAAKITVKKGKKAVSKVTVKKGKKVTLKVSVNSKGKLSVAKLSKKAKKIAKVTLKKGKLTIKGKKKGKVTLKIKAAKKGKYKKATKSIKVTVK